MILKKQSQQLKNYESNESSKRSHKLNISESNKSEKRSYKLNNSELNNFESNDSQNIDVNFESNDLPSHHFNSNDGQKFDSKDDAFLDQINNRIEKLDDLINRSNEHMDSFGQAEEESSFDFQNLLDTGRSDQDTISEDLKAKNSGRNRRDKSSSKSKHESEPHNANNHSQNKNGKGKVIKMIMN